MLRPFPRRSARRRTAFRRPALFSDHLPSRSYATNRHPLALALSIVVPAASQGVTPDPLAPLERYLGTWSYEGDGNGARVTCRSERQWIANRSFVESHRHCSTGNGPIDQVEVYGFDARRGLYVYWGFNGRAVSMYTSPKMGQEVAWAGEQTSRCTETFAPDGLSSTSQCEVTSDGMTWRRVSGGSSRKLQ